MAKRRFVLRVRPRGGQWTWSDLEPMTRRQADSYCTMLRMDGCDTQVWPEHEALEIREKEAGKSSMPTSSAVESKTG